MTSLFFEQSMASSSQPSLIGGHVELGEDLEHFDKIALWPQQIDIIMALQERVHNPPLGGFRVGRVGVSNGRS